MLFFQLSLILMQSASCRAGSGVVDVPLLGGEVLKASVTDGVAGPWLLMSAVSAPQIMMTYLSLDWRRAGL